MTRQTYRITIDVDDQLAGVIAPDIPLSLVNQIERDTNLFDVVLVETVDVLKLKMRERITALELRLRVLEDWRTEHQQIDMGAIVDKRLEELAREDRLRQP